MSGYGEYLMPFAGFEDFGSCVREMESEGHDTNSAENICGALQAEAKSEHGNVEQLMDALEQGAGLIADVGVDLVSGVDVPAVDSKWVMTKSGGGRKGHDYRANSPVLLAKDTESDQRISYAAAMIPREPDKEGDVVATPTVEKAAHGFLKQHGGVDTDHSLIDGEGEVVESWVLKEERTFNLPGGETETYGPGTWMVGIEWGKSAWDRIKAGELTGLSIYGMAEHVPLQRAAKCCDCGDSITEKTSQPPDTHKGDGSESDGMAQETADDGGGEASGDGATTDDGLTLKDLNGTLEGMGDTLETLKDAIETEKQDEQEAAAELGESYGFEPGDVLDILTFAQGKDPEAVVDALDAVDADGGGEEMESSTESKEDDEDEEYDEKDATEKNHDGANLGKGGNARTTAAKGVDAEPGGSGELPSYEAAAQGYEGEN